MGQICSKRCFPSKTEKNEYHDRILHIRIRPGTKFQSTDSSDFFFFFLPNLPQKGISSGKRRNGTCACVHGRYLLYQFVIFNPLSYCFEETIGFDVKASFTSRPESRLIR